MPRRGRRVSPSPLGLGPSDDEQTPNDERKAHERLDIFHTAMDQLQQARWQNYVQFNESKVRLEAPGGSRGG